MTIILDTKSRNTRFPLPILLFAGNSVKPDLIFFESLEAQLVFISIFKYNIYGFDFLSPHFRRIYNVSRVEWRSSTPRFCLNT